MAVDDVKLRVHRVSPEDLVEQTYFKEGVYEVKIDDVEFESRDDNSIYLNIKVSGKDGESGETKLFFTQKATSVSIDTIRKVLVHNADTEEKKAKIRESFQDIHNLLDLKPLAYSMTDGQAWLKVEKSDRSYTDDSGETKFAYNRNLYGFEPKIKNERVDKAEAKETKTQTSQAQETNGAINTASQATQSRIDQILDQTKIPNRPIYSEDIPF